MSAPRLDIDLGKISENTRYLVRRLAARGISVTGVTKASLGSTEIAAAMIDGGVVSIGESRIESIEVMRGTRLPATMALIRSPMLSQIERVVLHADLSFNTEIDVIRALSRAAGEIGITHGVVLMVELGDLREGILPADVSDVVSAMLRMPNVALRGVGTNLACRFGVSPDPTNMAELSALAEAIEARFGLHLDIVSGGNSANLDWALDGADVGRVNNLRLGESILLGTEPLNRRPIAGLHTDAVMLVAEVIESKRKPSQPSGTVAQSAYGPVASAMDRGCVDQALLALGYQDTDPSGLLPPSGVAILGASSDHLIVACDRGPARVGSEMRFEPNYSALARAMSSPFVAREFTAANGALDYSTCTPRQNAIRPVIAAAAGFGVG